VGIGGLNPYRVTRQGPTWRVLHTNAVNFLKCDRGSSIVFVSNPVSAGFRLDCALFRRLRRKVLVLEAVPSFELIGGQFRGKLIGVLFLSGQLGQLLPSFRMFSHRA
jgi:hypothetical protein